MPKSTDKVCNHNKLAVNKCKLLAIALFLAVGQINLISLGYAEATTPHNTHRERSVSPVHYRHAGDVEFRSWVDSQEFHPSKRDRVEVKERLLRYKKLSEERARKFSKALPTLSRCEQSKTSISKSQIGRSNSRKKFQIDLLFFDPRDGVDRSAAEMWVGQAIPYEPESPTTKSRLGNILGLECLPTRILYTQKGLEMRSGKAAWKVKKNDSDQDGKIFEKEIKQVQKDLAVYK